MEHEKNGVGKGGRKGRRKGRVGRGKGDDGGQTDVA